MTLGISIEPNEDLSSSLDTSFLRNDDKLNRFGNVISSFQNIPGLVGFWPMSSVQRSTGNAYDLSGQNRTLTYNGNPIYNIYNDFAPYIAFDGIGDGLNRADETDLDISGTETIYNSSVRGLTIGGWFRSADVTPVANYSLMAKFSASGSNRSYRIQLRAPGRARMTVSVDGIVSVSINSLSGLAFDDTWVFIVGRYIALTEIAIFVNTTKSINTTGIPASIFNSSTTFLIGGEGAGVLLFTGDSSLNFLSANALSDAFINGLFQQSRVLFGV